MKELRRWAAVAALVVMVAGSAWGQSVLFSTQSRFTPGSGNAIDSGTHRYGVRVQSGMTVEVLVRSDEVDTYLEAVLPNGERISNDDYDGLNAGFMRTIDATGTLEIVAAPLFDGADGPYEVLVTEVAAAQELELGETVQGTFGKQDAVRGRMAHRYMVRGEAGDRIIVDLMSDDFDAYLQARDDSGREFTDDDGGESGFDSRLTYVFDTDGVLHITATSFGGDASGSYELRVAQSSQNLVAEYTGELTDADNRAYDGKLYDRYEYEAREGTSVSILLESEAFDAVLFLANPDGTNLSRDDDSGGGSDSMINVTFPASGVYTIYVTPFFEGGGSYRLSIFE